MVTTFSPLNRKSPLEHLQELLADYLLRSNTLSWPGSDGLRIEDVVRAYPGTAQRGLVPSPKQLCQLHPDLCDAVEQFFACQH